MVSRRFLQQSAIAISIASLFYNIAEGVISVVFGAESSSHSLIFFGVQSVIEVLSASLVVWRFMNGLKADEEGEGGSEVRMSKDLRFAYFPLCHLRLLTHSRIERTATFAIGSLLVMLALAAVGTSIASLIAHDHPSPSNASVIIAASATFIMFLFWVPKRYLAKVLNSSTMNGEALCTLSCIQFSGALLIGSIIYRVWHGGWWVDSATAIVIAMLFAWEGFKMIRWASNDKFNGGCSCGQEERKEDKQAILEVMQQPGTGPQRCCGDSGCCKPPQESSNKV
jgi:predicted Co/Zn/Cd cation transporter (cation efflux family)